MFRGGGLDGPLGKHTDPLAVGRYCSMGCISTWTVQGEVLCQSPCFPVSFLVLIPLVLCLQPPKLILFPLILPLPCYLQVMWG